MRTWTIGQVAARFGIRASALLHYDSLGLVTPVSREGGVRHYDRAQLRRLEFLRTGRELGLPLERIRGVLDGAGDEWRRHVREQLAELAAQAQRIEAARELLTSALECPSSHPVEQCGRLRAGLDAAVDRR